ncbi:hypothetical protein ACO1O0_005153 [Amphichorda felina]
MLRVQSSRRAAGLKPTDYDHEISLVDHDGALVRGGDGVGNARFDRASTESPLLQPVGVEGQPSSRSSPRPEESENGAHIQERPTGELECQEELPYPALRPSIEIQAPSPEAFPEGPQIVPKKPRVARETVIDILFENERGGFFCGRPLFSSAALGSLDPPAWTNGYHKPSPTSIFNAQVPDPSWEWVWSDWHINQQEGVDEGGWEYSFAFSSKFSWHGARWYNSFVRRRAWTRKRAKKKEEDLSVDPHMPNGDYFTVQPVPDRMSRGSRQSLASSRSPSRVSVAHASSVEMEQAKPDVEDLETLLDTLRFSRIDREKLEATENYLENALDLSNLQQEMHEIMSLFIFQASRRLLLSHLMTIYDDTNKALEQSDTPELRGRRDALKAALKHADEEVRKLAYWSDVKQMAERGESRGAVASDKGWRGEWQGVDQSGPAEPNRGKLPGC